MAGLSLLDEQDGMQGLTSQQEKAALLHASGMSKSAAYEQAYNVTTTNRKTIGRNATVVFDNERVKCRVQQLREESKRSISHTAIDLKNFVLSGLIELAANAHSEAVRRQALVDLGKTNVVGLYKEEKANDLKKETDAEIQARVEDTLRKVLDKMKVVNQ